MKYLRKSQFIQAIILIVVWIPLFTFLNSRYCCPHSRVHRVVMRSASCNHEGYSETICSRCGKKIEVNVIPRLKHKMSETIVVVEPSASRNGVVEQHCLICSVAGYETFICPHEKTYQEVKCEATCVESGIEDTVCERCGKVVGERTLPKIDHSYGNWEYVRYATPAEDGERRCVCLMCGNTMTETYSFEMGYNAIYIEGTGVNGSFAIGELSQGNIDAYDMVYNTLLCGHSGQWVVGHDYGTMGHLPETCIGSRVWLSVNGYLMTYEVFISEYAVQTDDWEDIICQSSGYSIFSALGSDVLKIYTCYGGGNGRWVVFARLISR